MGTYQTISEFNLGDRVYGHFLLSQVECKPNASKKGEYLEVMLVDRTGKLTGKLWDCTEVHKAKFIRGIVVYATGTVTEHKGFTYLKIEHMDNAPTGSEPIDYVPAAPKSPEEMWETLWSYINTMKNAQLQAIVSWVVEQRRFKLTSHPAARSVHHDVYGGLLYHITTMLASANSLTDVYPFIDEDLLYAGIVLHDIEKTTEMDAEWGTAADYTPPGKLLGHIAMGVALIERAFLTLEIDNDELKMMLQHMMLSHHERPEWGSPIAPMLPEAVILHYIDQIDAKMFAVEQAIGKAQGTFTEQVRALDRREVYIPKFGK